ncbi:T9SS type A sorting domain-containing protein [Hymenobacter sp. GOD-10R]|uniref:T9SS type A sorting domain-containing protein n=1 Tax=Hymenobacter sp. GOD-10R TaxID=3093922 RepID=UPI002D768CDE|nr:T9SS type A sorting domain-containing protein [Hymenobacter sp. GOD-10R]WRQ29852.1 T9SS type A sorting domain-containing protein [Hymenobacter sp. GOD-10R]
MRHSYSFLFSAFLTASSLAAQAQTPISITRDDMPNVGDTLRVSQTVQLSGPSLNTRGANQTWNYASLRPLTQRMANYQSVASTPTLLQLTFGSLLSGSNRATIANRYDLTTLQDLGLPVGNVYGFFNESANDYRQVGFGVPVPTGTTTIDAPVTYRNQQSQDVVYRFPVTYEKTDSSESEFAIDLPGTAYLRDQQKRVNRADAWGTLITPFGTFATLRVVSTLYTRDSVSVSGAPGVIVTRPVSREYKWLGKNQGIPLLQVTTQLVAGNEVVTSVVYRDIYRRTGGVLAANNALAEKTVAAYPNPLPATADLRLLLPEAGPATLTATDLAGRLLFRQTLASATKETVVPAAAFGSFSGVALLRVQTAAGVAVRRVVRE